MEGSGTNKMTLYITVAGIWRGIIAFVGLLGNVLVILVYARKKCRTTAHVFIVGLAAADFISCMDFPFAIYHMKHAINFTDDTLCKITVLNRVSVSYFSLLLVGAVAVDRHQVCCKSYKRLKPVEATIVVAFCFVAAIILGSPVFCIHGVVKHTVSNSSEISVCGRRHEYLYFTHSLALLVTYLIVVIMMTVLYTRIAIFIRRARRIIHAISNQVPFDGAAGMRQVESGRHTPTSS